MPHRDAALHARHRGEHEHAGAVAGGIDPGNGGAGNAVDGDETAGAGSDTDALEADVGGVRHGPDGHQRVAGFDDPAVGEEDLDALLGALDPFGAGLLGQGRAALREDLFENGGSFLEVIGDV